MNRSSGAYTPVVWNDFAIAIRLPDGGGIELVKSAPSRRMALGMAFKGMPAGSKLIFAKGQDELSRSDRGRYGMETDLDRALDAKHDEDRRFDFWHNADLY